MSICRLVHEKAIPEGTRTLSIYHAVHEKAILVSQATRILSIQSPTRTE
jgi:hypothetical protein